MEKLLKKLTFNFHYFEIEIFFCHFDRSVAEWRNLIKRIKPFF